MAFDTNTITLKGAELLASATAQDRLILDGCDATTTYLDQATAVNISSRPVAPFSNTTTVGVIGATENHVMARVQFKAVDNTGGDVNTLMLYGHSESSPNDVYVIYVTSAQTAFHLPEQGDVVTIYEALMDMIYASVSGSVTTASTSVFTTLAEFNLLKERAVTTHKEGQPAVGEAQDIYGVKSYKDNLVVRKIYPESFSGSAIGGTGDGQLFETGAIDYLYTNTLNSTNTKINVTHPIVPLSDASISIGESDHKFKRVYTRTVNADYITENTSGTGVSVTANLKVKGDIIPWDSTATPESSPNDTSVGTFTYPFGSANIGGLMIGSEKIGVAALENSTPTFKSYAEFKYDISGLAGMSTATLTVPGNHDVSIIHDPTSMGGYGRFQVRMAGNSQIEINHDANNRYETKINTPTSITGDTLITGDVVINGSVGVFGGGLGIQGKLSLYGGLEGLAPSYNSGSPTIPIGGIFLGIVDNNISSATGNVGDVISPSSTLHITIAKTVFDLGLTITDSGIRVPDDGTYAALCQYDQNQSSSVVLLIRVS